MSNLISAQAVDTATTTSTSKGSAGAGGGGADPTGGGVAKACAGTLGETARRPI